MKMLIIYASKHGTTEKVARRISSAISNVPTTVLSVKEALRVELSEYDQIVLGSSIHAGRNQNSMQRFCKKHLPELLQKRVGLFLCCLNPKEYEQSKTYAYPELLRNHAVAYELMGGEYLIERMNFIERFLVKKMVGVTESLSQLDESAYNRFIKSFLKG